jgi:hypothetical protein
MGPITTLPEIDESSKYDAQTASRGGNSRPSYGGGGGGGGGGFGGGNRNSGRSSKKNFDLFFIEFYRFVFFLL